MRCSNTGRTSHVLALGALGALVTLAACGGGGSSSNPTAPAAPPATAPPALVATVISQGSGPVGTRVLAAVPLSIASAGSLEVTVDWTFATNDVDVFLVQGTCTIEQFNSGNCPFTAYSASTTAKPERLSLSSVSAGSYTLYIGNAGPEDESVAFQVVLTTTGTRSASMDAARAAPLKFEAEAIR